MLITCPSCGKQGRVPDHYTGKKVACKHCNQPILIRAAEEDEDEPDSPDTPDTFLRGLLGTIRFLCWGGALVLVLALAVFLFLEPPRGPSDLAQNLKLAIGAVLALAAARCVDGMTRW